MRVTKNKMERAILKIKIEDGIPISMIKIKLIRSSNAVHVYRKRKWDWVGGRCDEDKK